MLDGSRFKIEWEGQQCVYCGGGEESGEVKEGVKVINVDGKIKLNLKYKTFFLKKDRMGEKELANAL